MTKKYIGDGVYIDYDGYQIILSTKGNMIVLNSGIYRNLRAYAKTLIDFE